MFVKNLSLISKPKINSWLIYEISATGAADIAEKEHGGYDYELWIK